MPDTPNSSQQQQEQEEAAFEKLMALREGRRTTVYLDTLDKPTVGIGHLVLPQDNLKVGDTITDERVDAFFAKDGAAALAAARSQAAQAGISESSFIPYLASVNFQLGVRWTATFPNTWKMILDGEYEKAAQALEGTVWSRQTPVRVKDFQDALRRLPAKDLPPLPNPGDQIRSPKPTPDGVAGFTTDGVAVNDVLDLAADTRALARLICLEGAAPLAIAIFGGWGSGKSTFMDRLDSEITKIIDDETKWPENLKLTEGQASFVSRVVQIRFNAWQFVDTNLWVSLTTEFFQQLRAGGWRPSNKVRHAELVERVNSHVRELSAGLDAARIAAAQASDLFLAAQKKRDAAAEDASKATEKALGQTALNILEETYKAQKPELRALGFNTDEDAGKTIELFLEVVRDSASIFARASAVWRLFKASRVRMKLAAIAVLIALLISATIGLGFSKWSAGAIAGTIVAIAGWATAIAPAFNFVRSVAKRTATVANAVAKANAEAVRNLLQEEIKVREALTEVQARQEAVERSSRALARYIDPRSGSDHPRLLPYILEDDPDTKELQKDIGLIGRTRRMFQAVDDIVREEKEKPTKARSLDVPDRIVLYIDDLDRCTEQQVYAALQAIHLLLAFDLFVVVVGVDVTWVENALARDLVVDKQNALLSDVERRQCTARYLEKIFQIVFWLNPLASDKNGNGTYAKYIRELAKTPPPKKVASEDSPRKPVENSQPQANNGDKPSEGPSGQSAGAEIGNDPEKPKTLDREPESKLEALALIQLEEQEIEFLASAAIAATHRRRHVPLNDCSMFIA